MSMMMMGGRRPRYIPTAGAPSYAVTGNWVADGNIISPGGRTLPYKFFIPAGATPTETARPLVVYNGGAESVVTDTSIMLLRGMGKTVNENKATFPDYCLIMPVPPGADPQGYPHELDWVIAMNTLVLSLTAAYNIDATKRYYGGFSTGGIKTWDLAVKYPTLFAKLYPVAFTLRALHLGLASNGIVPSDIATDLLTREYVIDHIPTTKICMMVGDQDSFTYNDVIGTRDAFVGHGYPVTTVTNNTFASNTTRVLSVFTGYQHSDQMQNAAVSFATSAVDGTPANPTFWSWLHS